MVMVIAAVLVAYTSQQSRFTSIDLFIIVVLVAIIVVLVTNIHSAAKHHIN